MAGALGLEAFGTGGVLGGGAVAGLEFTQAEFLLDAPAFGLGALLVVGVAGLAQVAPHDGGEDVDVVVGVAYGHPPASVLISLLRNAGGVDDPAGDLAPFGVGQVAVARVGAY
ncbi:hypothetical protein GCM10020295_37170 [Streptomyces cinereospinus]